MAIEAVQLSMSVGPSSTGVAISELIRKPIRLLAVQVSWDGATATDTFSVFTTLETEAPTSPQPGDPPYLRALGVTVRVPSAFSVVIPTTQRRRVEPPVRFAFVYTNTDTTNTRQVSCTIWFDTEE